MENKALIDLVADAQDALNELRTFNGTCLDGCQSDSEIVARLEAAIEAAKQDPETGPVLSLLLG